MVILLFTIVDPKLYPEYQYWMPVEKSIIDGNRFGDPLHINIAPVVWKQVQQYRWEVEAQEGLPKNTLEFRLYLCATMNTKAKHDQLLFLGVANAAIITDFNFVKRLAAEKGLCP